MRKGHVDRPPQPAHTESGVMLAEVPAGVKNGTDGGFIQLSGGFKNLPPKGW